MLKKSNIQWTAKQLSKMVEKNTINFDNSVQRGLCWKKDKKILLIDSMLQGYPIPAFYAARNEDKTYDMLDGKQRCNAIKEFISGEFELDGLDEITLEDGTSIDINGMKFENLPEELQDRIKDYSLTVYFFLDITEDEISEMFYRLNNGKPLSAVELTRVKAKSFDIIKKIGQHEIFQSALSEKQINHYTNEDIVIKSYAVLFTENPSFETKKIRPLMQESVITQEQQDVITKAYDRLLEVYKDISSIDDKQHKKIAKRILTRTHLLSVLPIVLQSGKDGRSIQEMSAWCQQFFAGKKGATISAEYNSYAGSGSASTESVKRRLEEVSLNYRQYFKI